jgi:hypothetical protein
MAGINRGLAFLREQSERVASRSGNIMNSLWFKNDERAEFWFLNDENGMYTALMHAVERPSRTGGKPWVADVLCKRDTYDDPREMCPLCVAGAKGPWYRVGTLVFVTRIIYLTKREGDDIKPVKLAGTNSFVYQKEINEVRILLMKDRIARQAADIAAGISAEGLLSDATTTEPVNLMDYPFTVNRTGFGPQVVEVLKALQKKPIPEAVLAARVGADDRLREVMQEKFGQQSDRKRATTIASGAARDDDIGPVEGLTEGVDSSDDEDLVNF